MGPKEGSSLCGFLVTIIGIASFPVATNIFVFNLNESYKVECSR